MTLAPEQVPAGFIADLVAAGVRVALGHSVATYAQTRAAMAEGLTGFTHLFNAMRPLASREPGPIAAALEATECWFGMIVDGVHVDPAMLRLALRGLAQPMLVTDAMPPVGGAGKAHSPLWRRDRRARRPLPAGRRHARRIGARHGERGAQLRRSVGCAAHRRVALRVKQSGEFSRARGTSSASLAPGYRADLVAFDPNKNRSDRDVGRRCRNRANSPAHSVAHPGLLAHA